jgi:hypothetical protein
MSSNPSRLSESEEKEFDLLSKMPTGNRSQEQERRLDELLDKKCPMHALNEGFEDRELTDEEKQEFQKDIRSVMDFDDKDNDKSHRAIALIPEEISTAEKDKPREQESHLTNSSELEKKTDLIRSESMENGEKAPAGIEKDSGISQIVRCEHDLDSVREWAKHTRAEDGYHDDNPLSSVEREAITADLKKYDSLLVCIEALQGVGKTNFLYKLARENGFRYVAWEGIGAFFREFVDKLNYPSKRDDFYAYALTEVIAKYCGGNLGLGSPAWNTTLKRLPNRQAQALLHWFRTDEIETDALPTITSLLKIIGLTAKASQEFVRRIVLSYVAGFKTILFDLRDYDKQNLSQYLKDIAELEKLYKDLSNPELEARANIVIAVQKELPKTNYLFGKAERLELKPENPRRLVAYYRGLFHCGTEPFTEDALLIVAQLSRGIFRRWKEYVGICLRQFQTEKKNQGKLTLQDVDEWITNDRIYVDWEYEFSSLFERSEREQVFKVIQLLRHLLSRKGKEAKQHEIARDIFDGNEDACSRMLMKLEARGIIKRFPVATGRGHEKMVRLTDFLS